MIVLVFIAGLFVGSFLNVLIDRIPRGEGVFFGRSHCDFCKKTLSFWELIPILSFLLQKGRCRKCKKFIGWKYIVVEFITGASYAGVLWWLGVSNYAWGMTQYGNVFYYWFLATIFILIFFTDIWYGIIPDKILFPAIAVVSFYGFVHNASFLIHNSLLSGLCALLFFLFLFVITRGRGMGLGDVKFVFLMGLVLGFPGIIVGLYVAFLTGAIAAIILVLWGRKKFFGGSMPFGPFLVIGCIVTLLYGAFILQKILPLLP